jgi:hypothetical protein
MLDTTQNAPAAGAKFTLPDLEGRELRHIAQEFDGVAASLQIVFDSFKDSSCGKEITLFKEMPERKALDFLLRDLASVTVSLDNFIEEHTERGVTTFK